MAGIMMLADPTWLDFHLRNSVGKSVIFYASPNKRTTQEHMAPLFCVQPGKLPRDIVAVGRIQSQEILDEAVAWQTYGSSLGANTETDWRLQATTVLKNSRNNFAGKILAIKLVDFYPFPTPVSQETIGLTDTGWQLLKKVDGETSKLLLSFHLETPPQDSDYVQGPRGGLHESPEHKRLKMWVAENPESIGLTQAFGPGKTEARLASGDEIDVLFSHKKIFRTVEVKSARSIDADLYRGIYQCVKYREVKRAEHVPDDVNVEAILVTEAPLPLVLRRRAKALGVSWQQITIYG